MLCLWQCKLRGCAGFSLKAYLREGLVPLEASIVMAAGVTALGGAMADRPAILQLGAEIVLGGVIHVALLLIFARRRLKEVLEMAGGLRK